ncbi:MAG: GNAT family N-acetyltransferase [Arcobacter sp.]|nr:GNAT family N-acetyltransferase [Arcobacter sp.]
MKTFNQVEIKKIDYSYSHLIRNLFEHENKNYFKYFHPFDFNENSIKNILKKTKLDQFFGIFINELLIGFYILRGFDEGYTIPSYGVMISQKFSKFGLGKLSLQHAISFCKINKVEKIMLKVHPKNLTAKRIYESFGFNQSGMDKKNNNLIYYKNLIQ